MRKLTPTLPVLAAALFASCQSTGNSTKVPTRVFEFTYSTEVPTPEGAKVVEIWVPLPKHDPGVQTFTKAQITAPSGYKITRDPVYGNRMIYCRVENPGAKTKVSWKSTITRFVDRGQGSLPTQKRYLMSNSLIPIDGVAMEMAAKLGVANASKGVHDRAKRIYDDVLDGMIYDKKHDGWGQGSFEHATTVCKGNCTDFHSRFIGVGRAAGIPVRFTMGIPLKPKPEGTYNSYHCWAHYYDGSNWHPVDISEADKVAISNPKKAQWFFGNLDADRVSLSFGRDIDLSPPAKQGKRNYFVFPYAEADGKSIEMGKKDWLFTYKNL